VGRTGRGFAKGDAISFYSTEEREKLAAIEDFIQTKITQMKVHKQHLEEPVEPDLNESLADMIEAEEAKYKSLKKRKKR
jgi:ATP-dependent RNA helicase RhlE